MNPPKADAAAHVAALAGRVGNGLLSVPGCWDTLTLKLVEEAGFEAGFVSGAALSMAALGLPDLGYITPDRICDTVARMRDASALPLIVDGDTGFGNALTLQRFIRSVEAAGASAVVIEDQTYPKRCGHLAGKSVVAEQEAVGRIAAALDARRDLLIVARTDALGVLGVEAALDRAERFVAAGADMVFVEGSRTQDELARIADRLATRIPLVHNLVEGGQSPTREGAELDRLGIAVALHPLILMHLLVAQGRAGLEELRRSGSTQALDDRMVDLRQMNALMSADALIATGDRYAGES